MGAEGQEGQSIMGDLDPEEENIGWVIGCEAKIKKISIGIDYALVGADSVLQGLKDSDFGDSIDSTDIKGIRIALGYKITKHFGIGATALMYEAKERDLDQEPKTYQVDMKYKF